MADNNIVRGGDLMLFIKKVTKSTGNTETIEYVSIGYATSHTLSISMDTKETSTKDSGGKWQTSDAGIISWTMSTENLYANDANGFTYADLFEKMVARTPIDVVFDIEGSSVDVKTQKLDSVPSEGWNPAGDGKGFQGSVIITSLEVNSANGEDASFTAQFQGTGALTTYEKPKSSTSESTAAEPKSK